MEPIHYIKRNPASPLISPSPQAFAFKSAIYSDLTREFTDNSLNKEILKKTLQAKRLQKLRRDYEAASIKVQKSSILHQKLLQHLNNVQAYKSKVLNSDSTFYLMHSCATKIQKVVRGFLVRKNVEEVISTQKLLKIFKELLKNDLKTMSQSDRFCLFFVGRKSRNSVVVIQKFFRRCLFRKKIKFLTVAYNLHENQREVQRSQRFKVFFLFFTSKIQLESASEAKVLFLKLKKIRKNLAILKIKSILQRLKLKLKSIRYRVKRYSKRFIVPQAVASALKSGPASPVDKPFIAETKSTILQIEDPVPIVELIKDQSVDRFSHSTEYYITQDVQKKERIDKGRITYSIRHKSPSIIFPLLSETFVDARPSTTQALTIRMNLTNPIRTFPNTTTGRNATRKPNLRRKKQPKRYFLDETPPYMRETLNSKAKFESTPSPQRSPKPHRPIIDSKILYPTFSFSQKAKNPEQEPTKKPEHRPSRPTTGAPKSTRKVFRGKQISCASFIDYTYDPPTVELSELQQQNFRPLYSKLKLRPESMKPKTRKLSLS